MRLLLGRVEWPGYLRSSVQHAGTKFSQQDSLSYGFGTCIWPQAFGNVHFTFLHYLDLDGLVEFKG